MEQEKQYSILMTDILAQKTLSGEKTQTRRVIVPQPRKIIHFDDGEIYARCDSFGDNARWMKCRYGKVGTQLAVKELYFAYGYWKKDGTTKTGKSKMRFVDLTMNRFDVTGGKYQYCEASEDDVRPLRKGMTGNVGWYKRPSIFMPRRASRSIVEITDLRVERVQDISTEDAVAEGMVTRRPALRFQKLWDDINKARGFGWNENPFVWVITYKKI